MARIILLPKYTRNGILTVIENIFTSDFKRIFFIYNIGDNIRGGHRHFKSTNALICLNGSCKVDIYISENPVETYILDSPDKCLILEPADFRMMYDFSENAILLVVSDTNYDSNDYIFEQ